jgi:site-specific recombinase XerD
MTAVAVVAAQDRALPRETPWEEIALRAPQMVSTMLAYLDQVSVSHRATSVAAYSLALRHLAAHVTSIDPDCRAVAEISRAHIEDYKVALAARRGHKGPITKTTIRHNLGMVRTFFERIIDWDWDDAPRRVPIFAGDIPKADEPLPKFLDDPTAAKFMATLAIDPDRRRRLLVELLARTGMRAGELEAYATMPCTESATPGGCAFPSGNCTTTATSPCTRCWSG